MVETQFFQQKFEQQLLRQLFIVQPCIRHSNEKATLARVISLYGMNLTFRLNQLEKGKELEKRKK